MRDRTTPSHTSVLALWRELQSGRRLVTARAPFERNEWNICPWRHGKSTVTDIPVGSFIAMLPQNERAEAIEYFMDRDKVDMDTLVADDASLLDTEVRPMFDRLHKVHADLHIQVRCSKCGERKAVDPELLKMRKPRIGKTFTCFKIELDSALYFGHECKLR